MVDVLKAELDGIRRQLKAKEDELVKKNDELRAITVHSEQSISTLTNDLSLSKQHLTEALSGGNSWKHE